MFDAALPPLRALIRGGAHRTGRIGDAMRAWGRDAAFDARACIRRACLASLRVADATALGVQSVDMDGIGSNYSANSVSTEKATYKAMETLPAEVFAAVIRAATHALAWALRARRDLSVPRRSTRSARWPRTGVKIHRAGLSPTM